MTGHVPIDVTAELAAELLAAQHPDLADLPLRRVGAGWDNVLWRLGDDLALRLPVRAASAPLVAHEQRWLPVLAPLLGGTGVAAPVPVRTGQPSARYPWAWSVVPWFDGRVAATTAVAGRTAWAPALGRALAALHLPAPRAADGVDGTDLPPVNPFRGVPLVARDEVVSARLAAVDLPADERVVLRRLWADGLAAPAWDGPAVWLHGDPHPANLLVHDGRLRALLDFGDVTAGDPASDLSTAWLTFDAAGRTSFRAALGTSHGSDDATWRRARAWAVAMATVMLAHPADHPLLAEVGRHAVAELTGPSLGR